MTDEQILGEAVLAGRVIKMKLPTMGQVTVLWRRTEAFRRQLETSATPEERFKATTDMITMALDLVESLLVDPADGAFLEDAMLRGEVEYQDILATIGATAKGRKAKLDTPDPKKATRKAARKPAAKAAPRGRKP